ncbi:hypothetical protein Tco_0629189 [Tanacetum coccineum]|uniref:Uncharacterized protein n=1 Tax=Tanacetum coccineum TaxID=301880 RepID=A0ABQ4WSJ2_9ASTR
MLGSVSVGESDLNLWGVKTIPARLGPYPCRFLSVLLSFIWRSECRPAQGVREPKEMAPESSQVVVISKFDMHIHTSTLTTKELKEAIMEYCIPTDLHPRLPSPELTMDNLPLNVIGIYIEQLEQGGLRIHLSTFFPVRNQTFSGTCLVSADGCK